LFYNSIKNGIKKNRNGIYSLDYIFEHYDGIDLISFGHWSMTKKRTASELARKIVDKEIKNVGQALFYAIIHR